MVDAIFIALLGVGIGIWIAFKLDKHYELLDGISQDINEIKKHLGLDVNIRTESQRFDGINDSIDKQIDEGKTIEEILSSVKEYDAYCGSNYASTLKDSIIRRWNFKNKQNKQKEQ